MHRVPTRQRPAFYYEPAPEGFLRIVVKAIPVSDPRTAPVSKPGPVVARALRLLAALLVALGLGACWSETVSDPAELSITLSAQPTSAPVGRDIRFQFSAAGQSLSSVLIEFGDGTTDSTDALFARTAQGTRFHAYTRPGVFEAVATVTEVGGATATARATVTVTASAPIPPDRR
jgi:PKD repeat protein